MRRVSPGCTWQGRGMGGTPRCVACALRWGGLRPVIWGSGGRSSTLGDRAGQLPRGTWACKPGGEQDHAEVQRRGPVLSFAVRVWASGSDFKRHPGSSLSRVTSGDPEQPASCLSTYGVGVALPAGGQPGRVPGPLQRG